MPLSLEARREERYIAAGWSRSRKNNLWQRWSYDASTLTIFRHIDGGYKLCIVEPGAGPGYVPRRFSSEWEAFKYAEEMKAEEIEQGERDARLYEKVYG